MPVKPLEEYMKRITVIIPSRNRRDLLERAVKSVDQQDYEGQVELIIIDDASDIAVTEDSFSVKKVDLKVIRNDKYSGGAISRNIGIDYATGEYIGFLDDDDEYYSDKLSFLSKYLKDHDDVDVVFGKIVRDDSLQTSFLGGRINDISFVKYMHTNTSLIRKSSLDKIRFYEALSKYQDTQLHIEMIKTMNVHYANHPVARWYQNHGGVQITQMRTADDYKKAVNNFKLLINYLSCKKLLSRTERSSFYVRLIFQIIKLKSIQVVRNVSKS